MIKNNVLFVSFGDESDLTLGNRYQYDKGQILQFLDIPNGTPVEFANENHQKAEIYIVENSQVAIPDFLLRENSPITAYVKVVDENSETTIKTVTIPVKPRPEADAGVAPENQQTFAQQLQEIMNDTKDIAQSVRDDADNGVFKGDKGDKGDKGIPGRDGLDGRDGEPGKQGEQGPIGPKGEKGDAGEAGYTPVKGTDYFDGEKGDRGDKGEKGDTGETGPQGEKGEQGIQGPAGPQGAPGSDYVLTEEDKEEIAGRVKPYWRLIKTIKLGSGETASSFLVSKDEDGQPIKLNRIKIEIPKYNASAVDIMYIYFYDASEQRFNYFASTNVPQNDFIMEIEGKTTPDYFMYHSFQRKGVDAAVFTMMSRPSEAASTDGIIKKIQIAPLNATLSEGTEIKIYGGFD